MNIPFIKASQGRYTEVEESSVGRLAPCLTNTIPNGATALLKRIHTMNDENDEEGRRTEDEGMSTEDEGMSTNAGQNKQKGQRNDQTRTHTHTTEVRLSLRPSSYLLTPLIAPRDKQSINTSNNLLTYLLATAQDIEGARYVQEPRLRGRGRRGGG